MQGYKSTFCLLIITSLLINCDFLGLGKEDKDPEFGCTDNLALNFDASADENDNSCQFSTASFYSSIAFVNGIPVASVDVIVDGISIGSLSAFYPNGPGNCSAPGTQRFEFENGSSVDWSANIILVNGASIFNSGTARPRRTSQCVLVNVTR